MDHNPYSALSKLCFKYNCSPCDTQRVLGIMAAELENIGEEVERREEDQNKDCKETKGYWTIDRNEKGGLFVHKVAELAMLPEWVECDEEYGIRFETEEEAEKAVEKLKAYKRLKDKGFDFINFGCIKLCKYDVKSGVGNLQYQVPYYDELVEDLDIVFGDEE